MDIPKLQPSDRYREYNNYKDQDRAKVIHGWLFEGKTHRELDEEVLGLDRYVSKGYQAMGILHFLGLKKEFRGIFRNVSRSTAISALRDDQQDLREVIRYLSII